MHLKPNKIAAKQATAEVNRIVTLHRSAVGRKRAVQLGRYTTSSTYPQLADARRIAFIDTTAKMTADAKRPRVSLRRDRERAQKRLTDLEPQFSGRHCPELNPFEQVRTSPRRSMSPRSVLTFREAVNRLDRTLDTLNGTPLNSTPPNFGEEVLLLAAFQNPLRPSGESRLRFESATTSQPSFVELGSDQDQSSFRSRPDFDGGDMMKAHL
jgi:hypothetical protein